MNRVIHRSWGEGFVNTFLDPLYTYFSHFLLDFCLCSGSVNRYSRETCKKAGRVRQSEG